MTPFRFARWLLFALIGVAAAMSVLLSAPPGSGKTLLAKALPSIRPSSLTRAEGRGTNTSPSASWPSASTPAQTRCYEHDSNGNLTVVKDASLQIDPLNCGSCGNVCGAATPLCAQGKCTVCDPRTDADCDGIPDSIDNCRRVRNADQVDGDRDGVGDVCDNCPTTSNSDQLNTDGAGDGGDACDPDDDNDSCLDPNDDKPKQNSSVVGWRLTVACPKSMQDVFGWDGADSDGDGERNCAKTETDDDNDGVSDDADRCPTVAGTDPLLCQASPQSCPVVDRWSTCRLGGCNALLLKVVIAVNPAIFIQSFTIPRASVLVILPTVALPLATVENALLGVAPKAALVRKEAPNTVRLELWSKVRGARPGRLVAVLAEYDARAVLNAAPEGESALVLEIPEGGVPRLRRTSAPPVSELVGIQEAARKE